MPIKLNRLAITCQYRCKDCSCRFEAKYPGPVQCPSCNGKYVKWLNYAYVTDWLKSHIDTQASNVPECSTERTGTSGGFE